MINGLIICSMDDRHTDRQTDRQKNILRPISHGLQLQCHSMAIQRRAVLRPERSLPHRPPTRVFSLKNKVLYKDIVK